MTPYKTGYTFAPVNKSYSNAQSNQSGDYTAQVCGIGCAGINASVGGGQVGAYTLDPSQSRVDTLCIEQWTGRSEEHERGAGHCRKRVIWSVNNTRRAIRS